LNTPLISCIMVTRNRRRFVLLAMHNFLRQDYELRELIVVNDGDDPVTDLMPQDVRLRYVRLDRKQAVGAMRNVACRLASIDLLFYGLRREHG
jgi:glycosyltransferase involved in cell wall biosynthesis